MYIFILKPNDSELYTNINPLKSKYFNTYYTPIIYYFLSPCWSVKITSSFGLPTLLQLGWSYLSSYSDSDSQTVSALESASKENNVTKARPQW